MNPKPRTSIRDLDYYLFSDIPELYDVCCCCMESPAWHWTGCPGLHRTCPACFPLLRGRCPLCRFQFAPAALVVDPEEDIETESDITEDYDFFIREFRDHADRMSRFHHRVWPRSFRNYEDSMVLWVRNHGYDPSDPQSEGIILRAWEARVREHRERQLRLHSQQDEDYRPTGNGRRRRRT